ncbi:PINIT domain,Zinc finger, RING/FYVE/PHD-type,Zinc finger, MIZ-type [Cinara cedri]|uniref:PINIT domain,Zinc finger, RING/FYVE/PHD-type,Zinc finger, MIZ-type n=1 Tax=Cinara cedri TaxID=506608 RepID=A0A5E4NP12_9HEMI|nr:PINIT domain,Zinc finger, RING/FYVE/PHD-type,Zinc finger, MIZ-type [Cinara cedri]
MDGLMIPFQTTFEDTIPFFKVMETLMNPIYFVPVLYHLAPFASRFSLSENALNSIINSWDAAKQKYKIQVILIFEEIKYEHYTIERNITDRVPYNLTIFVNDRRPKLPKLLAPLNFCETTCRCNFYMDITREIFLKDDISAWNHIQMQFIADPNEYLFGIYLVEKVTPDELVEKLKEKPLRECKITKDLIKKSMESDIDMEVISMFATLQDPLSKMRMKLPARGVHCIHLQCFDALQFLQMNEHKQTWTCPLCKKKVKFEDIEIDEFFLNILESPDLGETCENVILLNDGSWSEKNNSEFSNSSVSSSPTNNQDEVFALSDSDEDPDKDSNEDPDKDSNEDSDHEDEHSAKRIKCL